jgi:hypothetical protein
MIENACNHETTGMVLDNDRLGQIEMRGDLYLDDCPFQFPERNFGLLCPFPVDFPTVF